MVVVIKRRKNVYKHSYQFHLFSWDLDSSKCSGLKKVFLDHQIKIEIVKTANQNNKNKKIQFNGDNWGIKEY